MKLLGTGLSGLVGSAVVESLQPEYEFENLSLETGVDITNPATVDSYMQKSDASWVLHFAAKTDVDLAEKERHLGDKSSTWIVNVDATETIVKTAQKYGKKVLYISTDFVFPGGDHVYTETDAPAPIGWYATTKYEGEKRVQTLGSAGLIVRITFPYGSIAGPRPDFVGKIKERLESGQTVLSPVDQIFTPTYLHDIADGIRLLLRENASGIYHLVGSESLSSYEASIAIANVFSLNTTLVTKTTAAEFYKGRAPRAFQQVTSNAKIQKLGLKPKTFMEGLALLKTLMK